MMTSGWLCPPREIKDRGGHARWTHYFIDGKSLCKKWYLSPSDPEPKEATCLDEMRVCNTCKRKLGKMMKKKFGDGWAKHPLSEKVHYYDDGLSICQRFVQQEVPMEQVPEDVEVCSYCKNVVRHFE